MALAAAALGGKVRKPPIGAVVFLCAIVVCAYAASDPYLALVGRSNSYALGLLGAMLALVYFMTADGDGRLLSLAGAVLGLYAFAQWAGINSGLNLAGNRPVATIGSPVDLGLILAMLLPSSLCRSRVMALAICLGLMATGSRGAWIAGAAGVAARMAA